MRQMPREHFARLLQPTRLCEMRAGLRRVRTTNGDRAGLLRHSWDGRWHRGVGAPTQRAQQVFSLGAERISIRCESALRSAGHSLARRRAGHS